MIPLSPQCPQEAQRGKFQTKDECLPNQFLHPHNTLTTLLDITPEIEKSINPKFIRNVTINAPNPHQSPLLLHMQHQSTRVISLLMRLSHVRILPHITFHTQKRNSVWSLSKLR